MLVVRHAWLTPVWGLAWACLQVPTLTKFGEEFEWFEPLRGLRGRDVRIVQMGRKDKRPFGNLGAIWMALFRNRDCESHLLLCSTCTTRGSAPSVSSLPM